jgi:branched-chain amino acid transport system substrate-binding protein
MFPGEVNQTGTYPNLMNIYDYVPGASIALPPEQTGCKMLYPS